MMTTTTMLAAAQLGFCYTRVIEGNCQDRISERLSLQDCCCAVNMGKGWSLSGATCQTCPSPGSGELIVVCSVSSVR